jgi:hypothetical protein
VWNREAGKNHLIKNCEFYQLGTGGIILDGGDRKTLTPGNNGVTNCEFYELNRWNRAYCPAIWLRGVGNTVSHNFIHDLPHAGILLSGNNHSIEYNEITQVCQDFDDMAAIYSGRNPSERGNLIQNNYFHHIESEKSRVSAIYFDDGESGGRVIGNVFYKTGNQYGTVHMYGGNDHLIENNIFVDCEWVFRKVPWNEKRWEFMVHGELWKKRLLQEVDITKPPYVTQYPELKDFFKQGERTSQAVNNVMYQCEIIKSHQFEMINNLITDENPGFVDVQNQDFRLREDAVVFKEIPDFQPIPFEKIGLQKDDAATNNLWISN